MGFLVSLFIVLVLPTTILAIQSYSYISLLNETSNLSYMNETNNFSLINNITRAKAGISTTELTIECPNCGLGDSNCDNVHRCTSNCGQIKSINYPFNYNNNHRCRWSIRAPNNYYVNLTIIDFDIPSSSNATKLGTCIFDYLTLIDGYTGKRLGCYCNENKPPNFIVSPWNELIIQFDTNSETTGRGFYFKYNFKKLELSDKIKKQMKPPLTVNDDLNIINNNFETPSICPNNWQYFRGNCYRAYNELEPLQWYDAENKCNLYAEGLDSHLISILDEDEMLVILYLLTNVWNSSKHQDYYIGLIDVTREGIYRWSDSNPMSYTDWELKPLLLEEETPAQPDGGAYEDCTVIRYNSFWRTSNWHDVPCSLGKHYHSHLEKVNSLLVNYNIHDYVNSYICKSDSISISSKARRPLYPRPDNIIDQQQHQQTKINETINNSSLIQQQQHQHINNNMSFSILDDNKYFVCDNTEAISVVLKCDGVTHCRDGSDESKDCDQDCFDWQFKCANGRCISIGNYCNFLDDCGDGSDESRCERRRCNLKEFKCQSGQCIPEQKRCDLLTDCSDSTDEGKLCTIGSNCNKGSTFQCYNGNCIPQYAVCDYQIDCPGKFHEDEDAATCEVILKSRFLPLLQSINNNTDHQHYHNHYNNNISQNQVNDLSTTALATTIGNNYQLFYNPDTEALDWAKENLFRCRSGNLIERNLRCLYEFDRYGYQIGCRDVSHLVGCENFECPQRDYVKCPNSYCIPWRYICDGKWDCMMGDDEVGCARYVCPGQYKCANQSSCILSHQLCDGHRQCPMGDDEWFCDLQCPPSCDCIGLSVNCRGANLTLLPSNYISKSIRKLDLSYNRLGPNLSNCDFTSFHDLGELILHHNNIEVLIPRKFHTLRNLYKLDLSNNQIHSVRRGAFAGLRRVTQLLLESNPELIVLEPEAFLGLSSLQMLNISSSRILTLKKNTFDGLTSLRYLLLRNNMINEIEDNAFRSLNSLVSLDMRGNEIKLFTKLIFKDLKSLRNLSTDSFKFCCLMNHQIPSDRCLPSPDEISDCEDLLSSSFQSDCMRIFGLLALIGNSFFIYIKARDRRKFHKFRKEKQVNSTQLLWLACSDLLMGIYLIVIAIADKYYRGSYIENVDYWRESIWCNLCGFLFTVSSHVSLFILASIAYNRFNELCYGHDNRHKLSLFWTHRLIAIFWLLSLTVAAIQIPLIQYFRGQLYARSGVCLAFHYAPNRASDWLLTLYSTIVFLLCICKLIALLYIVRCYAKIRSHIVQKARENKHFNHFEGPNIYKILFIIITQMIAWPPIIAMEVMSLINYPISAKVYSWIAVLVLPVNSAINPWFYIISSIWNKIKQYRHQNQARKRGNLNGQTKEMIPLSLNPSPRQKLQPGNFPPGYIPVKQYIRKNEHLNEDQLIKIALGIVSDIEQKHREEKVYDTLNLDNIFVSDKLTLPQKDSTIANGKTIELDNDNHNDQDFNAIDLGLNENNHELTVFIADYYGYRSKRPKCNHNENNRNSVYDNPINQHRKLYRRRQLPRECECADFHRLGDIIFKLIQLYNNSKLEQNEKSSRQHLNNLLSNNNSFSNN